MFNTYKLAALTAVLILAGCSVAGDGLWPDTADRGTAQPDNADAQDTATAPWTGPIAAVDPLVLDLPASQDVTETDTFFGKKIAGLRSDLNLLIAMVTAQNDDLQVITANTAQFSRRYQSSVEAIRSRLSAGTAPGNPELMAQVRSTEDNLDQMAGGNSQLTDLAARVTANAKLAKYVTASATSAMDVPGGVEEDHNQFALIIDDAGQIMTQNDRLLTEITATIARNDAAVATERSNLTALEIAVSNGQSYAASQSWMATRGGAALMVIGFDRAGADYETALRDAVSATLDRQPDARFELIAVLPQRGGSGEDAKRNAERVLRSLINMGLPTDRVIMVSETSDLVSQGEVQIYAR